MSGSDYSSGFAFIGLSKSSYCLSKSVSGDRRCDDRLFTLYEDWVKRCLVG